MKNVICHYHIYKNSGTSFDALLENNYGVRHICFDGPFPFFSIDQEQLSRVIERKNNAVSFSSHQIQLPVPVSLEFNVLAVVFVRHPLLRVLSIYKFKRQTPDGTTTSKAAHDMSYDDWVGHCLSDPHQIAQVSNAQTRFLGAAYRQRPLMRKKPDGMEYDLHQAIRNIKSVELLARTEYFNEDVMRFPEILRQHGLEFRFSKSSPKNATSKNHHKCVEDRVDEVKRMLSEQNYQQLLAANNQDIYLFNLAALLIENGRRTCPLKHNPGEK